MKYLNYLLILFGLLSFSSCNEKNDSLEILSLTLNPNGGNGKIIVHKFLPGLTIVIPNNTYTLEGYCFVGWNTNADGSGDTYNDAESIVLTQNTILYAQWEKYISISVDANGGEGMMPPVTCLYGDTIQLPKNTFFIY